jgi:hypothetical protein
MKALEALATNKKIQGVIALAALVGIAAWVYSKAKTEIKAAANAVNNVNAGTPYEGAGVVGTLGNGANQLSGGGLQNLGEWIGGTLADWFQPDPLATTKQSAGTLPSRKTAVSDNFYDSGALH